MSDTKPIPVRLDKDSIRRLDEAAKRLGNTRAGVVRLCLTAFLDYFESAGGVAALPLNWREIVDFWDGRTRRSRGPEPKPGSFPESQAHLYHLNEKPAPTQGAPAEKKARGKRRKS